jgi:hypothetical protein
MIGGIAFANGGEIDKQIRNIFCRYCCRLVDDRQMLQPGARFRRGDLLPGSGVLTGCLSGPKPQRFTSGPTVISIAPWFLRQCAATGDDIGHRFADRPRLGWRMVKAHQRRIVFPGGEQRSSASSCA